MIDQKSVAQLVSKKDRVNFFSTPFQHAEKKLQEG